MKSTIDKVSEELHIPSEELINRGVLAYLEHELRQTEEDIADLREKYRVADRFLAGVMAKLWITRNSHSHVQSALGTTALF